MTYWILPAIQLKPKSRQMNMDRGTPHHRSVSGNPNVGCCTEKRAPYRNPLILDVTYIPPPAFLNY